MANFMTQFDGRDAGIEKIEKLVPAGEAMTREEINAEFTSMKAGRGAIKYGLHRLYKARAHLKVHEPSFCTFIRNGFDPEISDRAIWNAIEGVEIEVWLVESNGGPLAFPMTQTAASYFGKLTPVQQVKAYEQMLITTDDMDAGGERNMRTIHKQLNGIVNHMLFKTVTPNFKAAPVESTPEPAPAEQPKPADTKPQLPRFTFRFTYLTQVEIAVRATTEEEAEELARQKLPASAQVEDVETIEKS